MYDLPHMYTVLNCTNNREHIRLLQKEFDRLNAYLLNVEDCFYKDLFDPNCPATYEETYRHYLSVWKASIERLKAGQQLVLVKINEDFFSKMFAPVTK